MMTCHEPNQLLCYGVETYFYSFFYLVVVIAKNGECVQLLTDGNNKRVNVNCRYISVSYNHNHVIRILTPNHTSFFIYHINYE